MDGREEPRVQFRVLGPVAANVSGKRVPLGSPLQRALLATLLLRANRVVTRDALVATLWRDRPPASAVGSLQIYVHGLRRALGAERIETSGDGYRIRIEEGELDLHRFEKLVERAADAVAEGAYARAASDLKVAQAIPSGPPLADLGSIEALAAAARSLQELYVRAAELQNDAELGLGNSWDVAARVAELVEEYPFHERFREQQMLALYRAGRQREALEAYRSARRTLVDELGVEPSAALQDLERAILRQDPALKPPAAHPIVRTRLPASATPLFGRHLELAAVTALLEREDVRQVTLTGPGGTGKTRLGLAVAEKLAEQLPGGAVFVDLAPIRDPALVASAVADAMRIRESSTPLERAVEEELRAWEGLLVLDNFEQVLSAAAWLGRLLTEAPHLLVLVTSRSRLRISWEHEYRVPPLTLPPEDTHRSLDAVASSDAVRLFVWRARAVNPDFALDEKSATAVASICRRVDGLPLAVELAAARSREIAPEVMATQIDRALSLLTGGAVDRPTRHQSLAATLDWSEALLGEGERRLFSRLSVFVGGFSAEAAAAVCDGSTDSLYVLVDHNLVHREPGRFSMLETIRDYALERLLTSGDAAALRLRHARHFLTLAEDAEQGFLTGVDAARLLSDLAAEHGNLRAALGFLHDEQQAELFLRLASALAYFWRVRGHLQEGQAWIEAGLELDGEVDLSIRTKALSTAGRLANRQGDHVRAQTLHEQALAHARAAGDPRAVGQALSDLGGVALAQNELERALRLYTESAEALRSAGHRVRLGTVLSNLGTIALEQGDDRRACVLASEALALQRETGDKEGRVSTYLVLARAAVHAHRLEDAASALAAALDLVIELDYREIRGYWLLTSAELACARGDATRVAHLLGAADAAFEDVGITRLQADDERLRNHLREMAATELGDEAFLQGIAHGRRLPEKGLLNHLTSSC